MEHRRQLLWLGILATSFYAAHGSYHLLRGHPENMLWTCQLGVLLVGAGLLLRWPALNAVGVLWLSAGTPMWIVGVLLGSKFLLTSTLTHLGGLAVGLVGVARLGLPRGSWWRASVLGIVLHVLSRWVTPLDRNINLAREVWQGFDWFPSHLAFVLTVSALCAAIFVVVERGLRLAFRRPLESGR